LGQPRLTKPTLGSELIVISIQQGSKENNGGHTTGIQGRRSLAA